MKVLFYNKNCGKVQSEFMPVKLIGCEDNKTGSLFVFVKWAVHIQIKIMYNIIAKGRCLTFGKRIDDNIKRAEYKFVFTAA